ncbi:hypothetical protein Tco_0697187 [Tanacetum coccineum]
MLSNLSQNIDLHRSSISLYSLSHPHPLILPYNTIATTKDLMLQDPLEDLRLVPSCFVIFDLEPLLLSFDLFEHEHVVMNPTSAGMRHLHLYLYMNLEIKQLAIKRVDEYGFVIRFPAQSVGSSNTDVLDLPCLLVLITGTSQSRQHVDTSLIHIESHKSPTKSLFDVGSSRISIFTMNTLSITRMFWQNHKDNA